MQTANYREFFPRDHAGEVPGEARQGEDRGWGQTDGTRSRGLPRKAEKDSQAFHSFAMIVRLKSGPRFDCVRTDKHLGAAMLRVMRFSAMITIAAAALGMAGQAFAQSDQDFADCNKGAPDIMIRGCSNVVAAEPNNAAAFNNRGLAYNKKGLHDRAIQDFDQAIRLKPDFASAFSDRGLAYHENGLYDRAIQDYDQAIRLDQNHALAFHNRGLSYDKKGLKDRAIQDYDRAIRLKPDYIDAFNNRGHAYFGRGMYDIAIADFRQALALSPDHVLARNNLKIAEDAKAKQVAMAAGQPQSASLPAGKKVILIVANKDYAVLSDLQNPGNDAAAMARAFQGMGYELVGGRIWSNLDQAGMDAAIQALATAAQGAAAAAVYYSGHGEQRADSEGRTVNYLFPTGANPATALKAERESIRLTSVLQALGGVRAGGMKLALIDACRNTSGRGSGKGLAKTSYVNDLYLVYATLEGMTAADGSELGRNLSPFAAALEKALQTHRTANVRDLFGRVTEIMRGMPEGQVPEKIDYLARAPAL